MSLDKILDEIRAERAQQDSKWGVQDHPSISGALTNIPEFADDLRIRARYYGVPEEDAAKNLCETAFKLAAGSYGHIAVEEMAEVIGAANDQDRRGELVQLAAVCAAWIESIDRKAEAKNGN